MQIWASIRFSVKWNIGRISSVPLPIRKALSTTQRPWYCDMTSFPDRPVFVIYPFRPSQRLSSAIFIDTHGYVFADFQELVVTTLVDVFLGQSAFRISLAESIDAFVAVPCVFLCPCIRIAHNQPLTVILATFNNVPVRPVDCKNPVFNLRRFVSDSRPDNIGKVVK